MRLTNYSTIKIIPGIYYFSVVSFFLIIFLNFQLDGTLFPSRKYFFLALAAIFVGLVYIYFGWKYFEYDSEGEVIVFLNRGVILSNFLNYRGNAIEIRRSRIVGYKIYNFLIYKRLVIHIKSDNKSYTRHCNVTFVSPRKINYLRQSLDKLIKKNKS